MKRLLSAVLSASLLLGGAGTSTVYADDNPSYSIDYIGNLDLYETQDITVANADSSTEYYAWSFTTTSLKQYYYLILEDIDSIRPEVYISKSLSLDDANVIDHTYTMPDIEEFGDVLGANKNLDPDTTYYLILKRFYGFGDYNAKIKINPVMDQEADIGELSSPAIADVTTYASLDGKDDADVWYFETGNNTYYCEMGTENTEIYFEFFSDEALTNRLTTYTASLYNSNVINLTTLFEKNSTYYIRATSRSYYNADATGYGEGYSFKMVSQESSGASGSDDSGYDNSGYDDSGYDNSGYDNSGYDDSGYDNSGYDDYGYDYDYDEYPSNTDSSSSSSYINYYNKIKKAKYFVTNMTSQVSGKIKGGKLTLKKGTYGFLCKKWNIKHNTFTKSKTLNKKKYKFKLAKGCKVIYGAEDYGMDDRIANYQWFNTNFSKWGPGYGSYNIGVCLNKKNKVTLIYISSFDVYCEQT